MNLITKKEIFKIEQEREGHFQRAIHSNHIGAELMSMIQKTLRSSIKLGDIFLDVGCAEGLYCTFASSLGAKATGVDISQSKLRRAVRESKGNFVWADWDNLPFKEEAFNIALFSEGPEHSLDPRQTLKEINRVLKCGGRLVMSAPVKTRSLYNRSMRRALGSKKKREAVHIHEFFIQDLLKLTSIEFKIEKWIYNPPLLDFPFRITLERIVRRARIPHCIIIARRLSRSEF